MKIFKFKSRKKLKADIEYLRNAVITMDKTMTVLKERNEWYEEMINKIIFRNLQIDQIDDSKLLVETKVSNNLPNNNATLVVNNDGAYLHLSKDLTEGYPSYTHLSINYHNGKIRYYLNNAGIGLEIDSNNRVKDINTLQFLKEYYSDVDGVEDNSKIEIIFEKI